MVSRVSSHNSWLAMGPNSILGIWRSKSSGLDLSVWTIEQSGWPDASILSVPTSNRAVSSIGF